MVKLSNLYIAIQIMNAIESQINNNYSMNIYLARDLSFCYYILYKSTDLKEYFNKGLNFLNYTLENIDEIPQNASVWFGYSGINYLVELYMEENLIEFDFSNIRDKINQAIIKLTMYTVNVARNTPHYNHRYYDVFYGLSGTLIYMVKNINQKEQFMYCIKEILKLFVEKSKVVIINNKLACDFFIDVQYWDKTTDYHAYFTEYYLDLGLSHGIAGPLMCLCYCYEKNIKVTGQLTAINNLMLMYKEYINFNEKIPFWNGKINLSHKPGKLNEEQINNSRPSWCYGATGILNALYHSYNVIKDEWCLDIMTQILQGYLKKDVNNYDFFNATFCHGYGSIYYLFYTFKKRKIFKLNDNCTDKFLYKILSFYNLDETYIFSGNKMDALSGVLSLIPILLSSEHSSFFNYMTLMI